jgi:hypothetical protein
MLAEPNRNPGSHRYGKPSLWWPPPRLEPSFSIEK